MRKKIVISGQGLVGGGLVAVYCLLLLSGCTERDSIYRESRALMDTFCTITVVSPSKEKAREAIEAGFKEIKRLETLLNFFADNSEITRINRAAGSSSVKVSTETLEILEKSVNISKATNGAFDPTIAPLMKHWRFSKNNFNSSIPSREVIENTLRLVDYRKIKINSTESAIYLEKKGMELDLGGIAKGYAADKAINIIMAKGIKAALVAIAGDIRGFGLSPSGQAWKIGIQNPRPESASEMPWEDIFASLSLRDKAVSTSGDYQRFFIKEGKRFHHIIDPATGFPSETDLISVSVIAPEGYLADSVSTAVFVLGSKRGIKLLESMGLDGVLVNAEKKILLTRNLKGKINILNKQYKIAE